MCSSASGSAAEDASKSTGVIGNLRPEEGETKATYKAKVNSAETKRMAEENWIRIRALPINPYLKDAVLLLQKDLGIDPDPNWRGPFEVNDWQKNIVDPGVFECEIDKLADRFWLPRNDEMRGCLGMYVFTGDIWWLEWASILGGGLRIRTKRTGTDRLEVTISNISPEHTEKDIELIKKWIRREQSLLVSAQDKGKKPRNRPMSALNRHLYLYQSVRIDGRTYDEALERWTVEHPDLPLYDQTNASRAVNRIDRLLRPAF